MLTSLSEPLCINKNQPYRLRSRGRDRRDIIFIASRDLSVCQHSFSWGVSERWRR